MGMFDFLAPKRETSTGSDTARYAAAEEARVRAQSDAARQQAARSIQGAADREWGAARERAAERKRRLRRAYR